MLSDTLHNAVCEIETYVKKRPGVYDAFEDHIAIVKAVMTSLQAMLDSPPLTNRSNIADSLTEDQKTWWHVTCEANIARWIECVQLIGPVTAAELIPDLVDAVERQDAMLTCEE